MVDILVSSMWFLGGPEVCQHWDVVIGWCVVKLKSELTCCQAHLLGNHSSRHHHLPSPRYCCEDY